MKDIKKIIRFLCGVTFCTAIAVCMPQKDVEAASKLELEYKVEARATGYIKDVYYTDYDYDGNKEAFIVTEESSDQQTLWFASDKEVKQLITDTMLYVSKKQGICKVSDNQKLFVIEKSGGGSGSWSNCLYVKNSKAYAVKKSGEKLVHISGKDFKIHPSEYDLFFDGEISTGHTWKAYYLKWTGSKFEQYIGKEISQAKLKTYKNGSNYLQKITEVGYSIGKIYYRKNGIININVYMKDGYSVSYDNVTLKVNGNQVKLVIQDKSGNNIVAKSGYGGVYKKKGRLF